MPYGEDVKKEEPELECDFQWLSKSDLRKTPNALLDNLIRFGVFMSNENFPWVIRPGSVTSLDRGYKYWRGSLDVIPKIRSDYRSEGIKSTLPIGESECSEYLATHKRALETLCGKDPKRNNNRPPPGWIKVTGLCPPVFPLRPPTGRPPQNEAYWDLTAEKCLPWWFIRERVDYQESLTEFWNEVLSNYTNKQPALFNERRLVLAHYDIVQYLYRAYIDLGIEWVFRKRHTQPRYPWTDAVKRANKFTQEDIDFYHQKDTCKPVYDFFKALIRLPETVSFYQQWGVVPSHPHWLITPWIMDERARQETSGMEGKGWYYHRGTKTKPSAQTRLKKLRRWQYAQREGRAKKKDYPDLVKAYQEIYLEEYDPRTAKESIEKLIFKFPCHSCTYYKPGTTLDINGELAYRCECASVNEIAERFQKKKTKRIPRTVHLCLKVKKFLNTRQLKTPALDEHNGVFDREHESVVASYWETRGEDSFNESYFRESMGDEQQAGNWEFSSKPAKHPCQKYEGMCNKKRPPDIRDCAICGPFSLSKLRLDNKKICVVCGRRKIVKNYFPTCSWECKTKYSKWLTSAPKRKS